MPNNRRRLTGTVVSNKMDKTVVVEVETTFRHPLYGKVIREGRKHYAHDEANECEMGDVVVIVEARRMSKKKRWAVQEIVRSDLSAQMEEVDSLSGVIAETTEFEEEEPAEEDEAAAEEGEE